MGKSSFEEQILPFTLKVNGADFCNVQNIMRQESWVKTNIIDFKGKGNILAEAVSTAIFFEKCWKT